MFLLRLYLIPEPSCGHLLTAQEGREMRESVCKAQPHQMPGSTSAAEIRVSDKSVRPGLPFSLALALACPGHDDLSAQAAH